MSEMIERVAQAIKDDMHHQLITDTNGFYDTTGMARAAIDAMQEHCANIAETHIPEGIHPDDLYRWRDTAGAIAAAIRSGN